MAAKKDAAGTAGSTSNNSPIRWEAPPTGPVRRNADRYQAEAAALMERPGDFGIIAEFAKRSMAYHLSKSIRDGKLAFTPAGAFESTTHATGDMVRVYARYVGVADVVQADAPQGDTAPATPAPEAGEPQATS